MSTPLLEARNLVKSFQSGGKTLRVLQDINLKLAAGETLAIMGPSGSGKSTLLGLLAGLDTPSAGQVLLRGGDLGLLSENELARLRNQSIGFVFQSYRLLPTLTALENVQVPLDLSNTPGSRALALDWLGRVGLKDRAGHFPAQLSGGEQQRVALARAMSGKPALLFADEPTGNLDSRTGREMAGLIFGFARQEKAALVLVTHEAALARRARRVVRLRDGRVA